MDQQAKLAQVKCQGSDTLYLMTILSLILSINRIRCYTELLLM